MIRVESGCVDCGLPCLYELCPNYRDIVYVCDSCGDDVDILYHFDGQEMCLDCIENRLERVEYND